MTFNIKKEGSTISYCIYLRKSRADVEAEMHGEGETLVRHERILLELAKKYNYNITQIYREIVSGDTISDRPVMQHLLNEVEQGLWTGVLVVEIERLARGDTIDQGKVALAFKASNTLIITPLKVYNPNNEYDEEYFEFGLFMSRREYKTINRRLQRGRIAAAKEGKYVAGLPPYGYDRVRIPESKGWTLQPNKIEAETVRLMFNLYAYGMEQPDGSFQQIGLRKLGKILDNMNIAPPRTASYWTECTIRNILKNPIYIGKIYYNTSKRKKIISNGIVSYKKISPPPEEQIISNGIHPPLISVKTFNRVQEIFNRHGAVPIHRTYKLQNPFAGILYCGKCGKAMVLKESPKFVYCCPNRNCNNIMSYAFILEERIIQALSQWLDNYRLEWSDNPSGTDQSIIALKEKNIAKLQRDIDTLNKQLSKTHDLLEQGVYDIDTFLARSRSINERSNAANKSMSELLESIKIDKQRADSRINIIPKVEKLLDVYSELPDAQSKNEMLKEIVERIEYVKEKRSPKKGPYDNFELVLFPKLPYK